MPADVGGPSPEPGNFPEFLRNLNRVLPELTRQVREEYARLKEQEEQRKKKELEIGWVGHLIGDHEHAPTRIAFIVIVVCAVILVPVALMAAYQSHESALLDKIITGALSIISAALGFVFGRSTAGQTARRQTRAS